MSKIPDKSDPRWKKLVTGQKEFKCQVVPASMLLSRMIRSTRRNNSPENIQQCVDEAYNFFKRYEAILTQDIENLFDEGKHK